MNQKIEQLISQCEDFGTWENKTYTFDKQKFAELIVKECIAAVQSNYTDRGTTEAVISIEKHFGVE